jgi:hypothetical protein
MNPQVNNGSKGVDVFSHILPGDDTYCDNGY